MTTSNLNYLEESRPPDQNENNFEKSEILEATMGACCRPPDELPLAVQNLNTNITSEIIFNNNGDRPMDYNCNRVDRAEQCDILTISAATRFQNYRKNPSDFRPLENRRPLSAPAPERKRNSYFETTVEEALSSLLWQPYEYQKQISQQSSSDSSESLNSFDSESEITSSASSVTKEDEDEEKKINLATLYFENSGKYCNSVSAKDPNLSIQMVSNLIGINDIGVGENLNQWESRINIPRDMIGSSKVSSELSRLSLSRTAALTNSEPKQRKSVNKNVLRKKCFSVNSEKELVLISDMKFEINSANISQNDPKQISSDLLPSNMTSMVSANVVGLPITHSRSSSNISNHRTQENLISHPRSASEVLIFRSTNNLTQNQPLTPQKSSENIKNLNGTQGSGTQIHQNPNGTQVTSIQNHLKGSSSTQNTQNLTGTQVFGTQTHQNPNGTQVTSIQNHLKGSSSTQNTQNLSGTQVFGTQTHQNPNGTQVTSLQNHLKGSSSTQNTQNLSGTQVFGTQTHQNPNGTQVTTLQNHVKGQSGSQNTQNLTGTHVFGTQTHQNLSGTQFSGGQNHLRDGGQSGTHVTGSQSQSKGQNHSGPQVIGTQKQQNLSGTQVFGSQKGHQNQSGTQNHVRSSSQSGTQVSGTQNHVRGSVSSQSGTQSSSTHILSPSSQSGTFGCKIQDGTQLSGTLGNPISNGTQVSGTQSSHGIHVNGVLTQPQNSSTQNLGKVIVSGTNSQNQIGSPNGVQVCGTFGTQISTNQISCNQNLPIRLHNSNSENQHGRMPSNSGEVSRSGTKSGTEVKVLGTNFSSTNIVHSRQSSGNLRAGSEPTQTHSPVITISESRSLQNFGTTSVSNSEERVPSHPNGRHSNGNIRGGSEPVQNNNPVITISESRSLQNFGTTSASNSEERVPLPNGRCFQSNGNIRGNSEPNNPIVTISDSTNLQNPESGSNTEGPPEGQVPRVPPLPNVSNVNVNFYRAVPVNVVSSVPQIICQNSVNQGSGNNVSNVQIVQAMPSVSITTSQVTIKPSESSQTRPRTFTSTEAQTDDTTVGNLPTLPTMTREQRRRERRERRHQRRLNQSNHQHQSQVPITNANTDISSRLPDILNSHLPPPYTTLPQPVSVPQVVPTTQVGTPVALPVVPPVPVAPPPAGILPYQVPLVGPPGTTNIPGHQTGFRFSFPTAAGFRRCRSRLGGGSGRYATEEEGPKGCCGVLVSRPGGLRWFIALIALVAVCCVLVGTVLGAMRPAGRDHLTVSLLMIGVGIVLVTVSGVAWRLTSHDSPSCRAMLGLDSGEGAGADGSCPRRFVPRLPPSYGRPHHPYAAMIYPEFQYRPPPPSYQASMQEYRLRLLLLDRGQQGAAAQGAAQAVVSPPPTYRSHAGSLLRAPLSSRRDATQSEYSCPPSYRSRSSSNRPGDPETIIHSREQSLTLSESNHESVVNVVNILTNQNEEIALDNLALDSLKCLPDGESPLRMLLKGTQADLVENSTTKEGNLVTIVQKEDQNPVIVTVSGSQMSTTQSADVGSSTQIPSEMEILAHL